MKFKELYMGDWEIDPRLKELNEHLREAREGYYCAISAMNNASETMRPDIKRTVQKYFDKIRELKKIIKELYN